MKMPDSMKEKFKEIWGDEWRLAILVSGHETGFTYQPDIVSPTGKYIGLFQVNKAYAGKYNLKDAIENMIRAKQIRDQIGWKRGWPNTYPKALKDLESRTGEIKAGDAIDELRMFIDEKTQLHPYGQSAVSEIDLKRAKQVLTSVNARYSYELNASEKTKVYEILKKINDENLDYQTLLNDMRSWYNDISSHIKSEKLKTTDISVIDSLSKEAQELADEIAKNAKIGIGIAIPLLIIGGIVLWKIK